MRVMRQIASGMRVALAATLVCTGWLPAAPYSSDTPTTDAMVHEKAANQ